MVMRIRLLVGFVTLKGFSIIFYMLSANCGAQSLKDFFGYGIVSGHVIIHSFST